MHACATHIRWDHFKILNFVSKPDKACFVNSCISDNVEAKQPTFQTAPSLIRWKFSYQYPISDNFVQQLQPFSSGAKL